jgi:hypothetical protein
MLKKYFREWGPKAPAPPGMQANSKVQFQSIWNEK